MHRHILIEAISPSVDGGRYPAKGIAGESCRIEADVFRDGHGLIRAVVKWRKKGEEPFSEVALTHVGNDRFEGEFPLSDNALYEFTIEAWTDRFGSWLADFEKKVEADRDVALDALDALLLLDEARKRATGRPRGVLEEVTARLSEPLTPRETLEVLLQEPLQDAMALLDQREDAVTAEPLLEVFANRRKASVGTWYELFPRSETSDAGRGAPLREAERRLPKLAEMGFDVVYLPPVHPIGVTNRKGKNDALTAEPGDPGCPWAIGSADGGHTEIAPELGTIDDFDHFVAAAAGVGMEIALDFAIQCSPDHPWVSEHPDWFEQRADGSIRYAENPPHEYTDVCRVDFDTQDRVGLFTELYRVLLFWIGHGVTIFRVDNPHTKPVGFWEWLIAKVHASHPEVIFLAEAFTRPKMMKALAKAGFTQSYTYFTWRNEKRELEEYLIELTQTEMRHYFTPNFFTNTHDVLPELLQKGGPPAFKMRLVLAATLSPSYGIYSGYELCENQGIEGKEEYLDSEKFEIKPRDYDAPGNLNGLLTKLNEIRRNNPALHELCNVSFLKTDSDKIVAYRKSTRDNSNTLLIVVNLDPFAPHHCTVEVPWAQIGLEVERFQVRDLLTGARYAWGEKNYVRLDPAHVPAHILLVEKEVRT
jgi:starch synthase (maltosyl-transferring)